MEEDLLPEHIRRKATVSGNEYAWRMDDFPAVIVAARSVGLAVRGGVAQFHLADCVCEPFWLRYSAERRSQHETWDAYVQRSTTEVSAAFASMCESTDFVKEAMEWEDIRTKVQGDGVDPMDYLRFVIYFESNDAS